MSFFSFSKTIIGSFFSKPATRMYPFTVRQPYAATRGSIAIDVGKCILCGLCAKRCPSRAIVVNKAERRWDIDRLSCCTCAACVEVCPTKCLTMETGYTAPETTRPPFAKTFPVPAKQSAPVSTQTQAE
jgi:formate hydrogenlyase subunit 6/NADH:ubiquinone oxidoreductase subunit I